MKKMRNFFAAMFAAALMLFVAAAPANASVVTMNGTTDQNDILNVIFHYDDATNVIDEMSGTIDLVGVGLQTITGVLPVNPPGFLTNNLWDPASLSPSGFDWSGVGFSMLSGFVGNLFDENPQGSGAFTLLVSGTNRADLYPIGHVVTKFDFTTTNDVPEPAGLALFGIAVVGLLASRRSSANSPSLALAA